MEPSRYMTSVYGNAADARNPAEQQIATYFQVAFVNGHRATSSGDQLSSAVK